MFEEQEIKCKVVFIWNETCTEVDEIRLVNIDNTLLMIDIEKQYDIVLRERDA